MISKQYFNNLNFNCVYKKTYIPIFIYVKLKTFTLYNDLLFFI